MPHIFLSTKHDHATIRRYTIQTAGEASLNNITIFKNVSYLELVGSFVL